VSEAVTVAIVAATPPMLTAIAAVLVAIRQGRSTRKHVVAVGERVEHAAIELTPNHGSSVHDKVDQALAATRRIEKSIGGLHEDSRKDREAANRRFESLERRFETVDERLAHFEHHHP